MQVFLVFVCCIFAIAHAGGQLSTEFKEKLIAKVQEVGMKCAEQEQANGEDIGELMAQKSPTRKEGKCLIACFNQAYSIQDQNGKFTKEGMAKSLEPFKKENVEVYQKLQKLMNDCFPSVKSSDRCDAAAEMSACATKKAEAAGLTMDIIM